MEEAIHFSDLLILMVVIWTAGKVFRALKLPVVFGELLGGIIVGPLLLNIIDPGSDVIRILAELGIFFLMLHTGLETNPDDLLKSSKKSFFIALGGVILPMLGGYYVSRAFGMSVETAFFIGMGISISSIAITARIFKDCRLLKTSMAHVTLGAAVGDDIMALVLFSVALNLAETGSIELIPLLILVAKILAFFAIVILGGMKISPYLNRWIKFKNKGFTLTLIIALTMGWIAESIGLHMVIGAFLAGLFIREEVIDEITFKKIEDRVYGLSYGFFGPIFFASLAFHLDFTAFKTAPVFFLAIVAVAILGKLIGSGLPAKWLKMGNVESLIVGLSMNNRGAVELIIASIGLQQGIIDANVFSILVMMAFITTIISIVTVPMAAKRLPAHR